MLFKKVGFLLDLGICAVYIMKISRSCAFLQNEHAPILHRFFPMLALLSLAAMRA